MQHLASFEQGSKKIWPSTARLTHARAGLVARTACWHVSGFLSLCIWRGRAGEQTSRPPSFLLPWQVLLHSRTWWRARHSSRVAVRALPAVPVLAGQSPISWPIQVLSAILFFEIWNRQTQWIIPAAAVTPASSAMPHDTRAKSSPCKRLWMSSLRVALAKARHSKTVGITIRPCRLDGRTSRRYIIHGCHNSSQRR
jgi:hypothetical protein